MVARNIPIGVAAADGRRVVWSPKRRSVHMHVMGASGRGKTKFLEHCIREDILAGHGVCLIDPEGGLYNNIRDWLALHKFDQTQSKRGIHLFDAENPEWRFRFNPLYRHHPGEDIEDRLENMITTLAQIWREDTHGTPAIRTTLSWILYLLMNEGLSLAEAYELTLPKGADQLKAFLTSRANNDMIKLQSRGYEGLSVSDYNQEFFGARRRFNEVLLRPKVKETLATYENPIDFSACMERGDIVLVNLSPKAVGGAARTFGALLLREMLFAAERRDERTAEEQPFFAYIDECPQFLTDDISEILAKSRKRGFRAVLAHQWLSQLRDEGEAIYGAMMGIQNKVIFGGLPDDDAHILANELFRDQFDLQIPVELLRKPTLVGYERTLMQSWNRTSTENWGQSKMASVSEFSFSALSDAVGQNISYTYDQDGYPVGTYTVSDGGMSARVDGSGTVVGTAEGSFTGGASAEGSALSEALQPILEMLPTARYNLDEIAHMYMVRLRQLPERHAFVMGAPLGEGGPTPTFELVTFDVDPVAVGSLRLESFQDTVFSSSPYTMPTQQVQEQLSTRQRQLSQDADYLAVHGVDPAKVLEGELLEDDDGRV